MTPRGVGKVEPGVPRNFFYGDNKIYFLRHRSIRRNSIPENDWSNSLTFYGQWIPQKDRNLTEIYNVKGK